MKRFRRSFAFFAGAALSLWMLSACQEKAPGDHEEIVRAGLAEILSHQEAGCEEVISWEIDDRFDYLVRCKNGSTFRIHVGKEGHVNVETHGKTQNQQ